MLTEYFIQYLKIRTQASDGKIRHYLTAINAINSILEKENFPLKNIFDISTLSDLNSVKIFLEHNKTFIEKNALNHKIYAEAFENFFRFACDDTDFYKNDIENMDIHIFTKSSYNQIIDYHVTEAANYKCENNGDHTTFISEASKKPFMEVHHLIPLKNQNKFKVSLNVYANAVCLCPTCHKLLHYGIKSEKELIASKLFEARQSRLAKSGINITFNDFKKLI